MRQGEADRRDGGAVPADEAVVTNHFAAAASRLPLPPVIEAAGTTILCAAFANDDSLTAACGRMLSAAERERAGRFATAELQRAFVQRRAFRRYAAARATGDGAPLTTHDFAAEPGGRPWLPTAGGVSWSFSSCRQGMLAAWSCGAEVGVDLEDRARQIDCLPLASRFFDAAEARLVAEASGAFRVATFLRLWCLKEAALKAIGKGIVAGLDRFVFTLEPTARLVAAPQEQGAVTRFTASEPSCDQLQHSGLAAAVVLRMPAVPVRQSHSAGP